MLDDMYFSVPPPPSQDSQQQQQQQPLQQQQQKQQQNPPPALPFQNQLLSSSFFGNHASCLDSISSSVLHHHHHQKQNLPFLAPPSTTTHHPSGALHDLQQNMAEAAAASSHLDNQNGTNKISTPTTNQLDHRNNINNRSSGRLKPPRAPSIKKDRHSKIYTAKGLRDRRVRLSMNIARNFFNLQDILGFDKASKTLEWLFSKSKGAIDEVAMEYNNNNNDDDKGRLAPQLGAGSSKISFMLSSGHDHERADQETAMPNKEKTRSGSSSSCNRVVVDSVVAREMRAKARERARERTKEKMTVNKKLQLQQHNNQLPNDHGHHHHHHHEHDLDDHHTMNQYLFNNNNNNNNNNPRSCLINGISDIDQFEDQGSCCSSGTHKQQQQQLLWNSNPGSNESTVIKTKPKLAINYSTTSSSTAVCMDHHHQSFVPISHLGTKGAIASSSLSALSHVINLSNREFMSMRQKPLEICGYQILR